KNIQNNTTGYVCSVKPSNKEKEVSKCRRSVLVFHQIRTKNSSFNPLPIYQFSDYSSFISTVDKVCPLPSLATDKSQTAQNSPKHVLFNIGAIFTMTSFNGQYHGYTTEDQYKGHDPYKNKGKRHTM